MGQTKLRTSALIQQIYNTLCIQLFINKTNLKCDCDTLIYVFKQQLFEYTTSLLLIFKPNFIYI